MNRQVESKQYCPYCGEALTVLIDLSIEFQSYIEDCQVCCRPINFDVSVDEDNLTVVLTHEDD